MEVLPRLAVGLVLALWAGPALGAAAPGAPDAAPLQVEVERRRPQVLTPGAATSTLTGPEGSVALSFGAAPAGEAPEPPRELERVARRAVGAEHALVRVRPLARWESDRWAWGWSLDVSDRRRLEAWRVYLDGQGRLLGRVVLARSAGAGRAFARSPLAGDPETMTLADRPDPDVLAVPGLAVVGCVDEGERVCRPSPVAAADGAGDWLFEADPLDPGDAFAEVHAFLQLADARRRLEAAGLDRFARTLLTVVNVRFDLDDDGVLDPFDNALYFPHWDRSTDALLFGQAATGDTAYDVDVLRHELTHAATAGWLDLAPALDDRGYDHLPALLGEGWADYFAATASGDPEVAPYLAGLLGLSGPLRRLDLALTCPEHLSGDAHADSRMWSGALWDLRNRLGPDFDVAVAAAIRALPDQPTVAQAAEATVEAARVGLGETAAEEVQALFEARGLPACGRLPPLEVPGAAEGLVPVSGVGRLSPGALQYVVKVPEEAGRMTLRLDSEDVPLHNLRLYVREGRPVEYRVLTLSMSSTSVDVVSDAGGTDEVVLEGEALKPGGTLYVSPGALSDRTVRYRLQVEVEAAADPPDAVDDPGPTQGPEPAPEDPGAAPGAADPDGGGCSASAGPTGSLALLLVVLVLRARRRRARP